MLSVRFLSLLLSATILKLCSGQCRVVSSDLNTKWRLADAIEQTVHDYYQSLALGPDDADDTQKRFISVYSLTLLMYLTSNKTQEIESAREAAHRAREQLDKPADVIAAPFRSLITLMMNILEQPLTDVQATCPYNVREDECKSALAKLQADRIKDCTKYTTSLALYKLAADFFNICGFQNLLDDLVIASEKGRDSEAIDLLVEFVSVKYTSTLQFFKRIFKQVRAATSPCNTLSFL